MRLTLEMNIIRMRAKVLMRGICNMNSKCEVHNEVQNQVLHEEKLVVYCPECAKKNILSLIQFEDQLQMKKEKIDIETIQSNKKNLYKQMVLGLLIALYIQMIPWIFAPFFYPIKTLAMYLLSVEEGYKWMWTQGWVIMLSLFFIIWGILSMRDALIKIRKLNAKTGQLKTTKKDITNALKRFNSTARIQQVNDFVKTAHKKYVEQKTTITPIEVMTEYELTLYYAKLMQHLGYRSVKLTIPNDSYGVNMIGVKSGIKVAMMVVKDIDSFNPSMISKLGVGRAYFECEEALLLAHEDFPSDIVENANALVINCWNMKDVEANLTSDTVDEWTNYLEVFLNRKDKDLKNYSMYEKQRLQHLNDSK